MTTETNNFKLPQNFFNSLSVVNKTSAYLQDLARGDMKGPAVESEIEVFTGTELLTEPLEEIPYIVNPIIPYTGVTMLSGAPGIGKTAFGWGLGNAMAEGTEFLGHSTRQGKMLYISLDMTRKQCKYRMHKTGFEAKFKFVACNSYVNCLSPNFRTSSIYKTVRELLEEEPYSLVAIDALIELIGDSISDDKIPSRVKATLKEWMPSMPILLLHHTRKEKYTATGEVIHSRGEQSSGSQFWRGLCSSHIILEPTTVRRKVSLKHDKSQVDKLADDLEVFVDLKTSTLKLWSDYKEESVQERMQGYVDQAKQKLPTFDALGKEAKVRALMDVSGKSRSTIWQLIKDTRGLSDDVQQVS